MSRKQIFSLKLLTIYLAIFKIANSWTVSCDYSGLCLVGLGSSNNSVFIRPGYMPILDEKNIVPSKNLTTSTTKVVNVNQKPVGKSYLGYLPGSMKYECAGGYSECRGGCCRNGICSDPADVCTSKKNEVKLIYLIVGFLFLVLFIIFSIVFYIFGHIYNEKPKVSKSENIYIRFNPSRIPQEEVEKLSTNHENLIDNKFDKNKDQTETEKNNKEINNFYELQNKNNIPQSSSRQDNIPGKNNNTPEVELENYYLGNNNNNNQDLNNRNIYEEVPNYDEFNSKRNERKKIGPGSLRKSKIKNNNQNKDKDKDK